MTLTNITLFGNRVYADRIKLRISRYYPRFRIGPKFNDRDPYKRKERDIREEKREGRRVEGGEGTGEETNPVAILISDFQPSEL